MTFNRTRWGPYRILSSPNLSSHLFFGVGLERWQACLSPMRMISWEFATWTPVWKVLSTIYSCMRWRCGATSRTALPLTTEQTKKIDPDWKWRSWSASTVIKMEATRYIYVFLATPVVWLMPLDCICLYAVNRLSLDDWGRSSLIQFWMGSIESHPFWPSTVTSLTYSALSTLSEKDRFSIIFNRLVIFQAEALLQLRAADIHHC